MFFAVFEIILAHAETFARKTARFTLTEIIRAGGPAGY
jgi:hypothetical protein